MCFSLKEALSPIKISVLNHGIYLQLSQQAYCQDQEVQSHTFETLEKKWAQACLKYRKTTLDDVTFTVETKG